MVQAMVSWSRIRTASPLADRFLFIIWALILGFAVFYGAPAWSGEGASFSGEVVKADTANQSLVVRNPETGGRFRFHIGKETALGSGPNPISLSEIPAGGRVRVEYEIQDGLYLAHRVDLLPKQTE